MLPSKEQHDCVLTRSFPFAVKEICTLCQFQGASDLVEEWIAFATSARAGDHEPTLASLEEFERQVLTRR